ncbi:unnamed protein product [Microthlaspi erraticum]|uniref:Uncharacterized protein n=1 Tax=Microthlaspi erraticum TaxID=1685480 RepID=A0A6D2KP79_9BRAS|nr:unnamed protein product [Microthlaspi erraticum]
MDAAYKIQADWFNHGDGNSLAIEPGQHNGRNDEILGLYEAARCTDEDLVSKGLDDSEAAESDDRKEDAFLAKLAEAETPLKKLKKVDVCPKCKTSRWKTNMHTGEIKKGVPQKVLRLRGLTPVQTLRLDDPFSDDSSATNYTHFQLGQTFANRSYTSLQALAKHWLGNNTFNSSTTHLGVALDHPARHLPAHQRPPAKEEERPQYLGVENLKEAGLSLERLESPSHSFSDPKWMEVSARRFVAQHESSRKSSAQSDSRWDEKENWFGTDLKPASDREKESAQSKVELLSKKEVGLV